MDIKVVEVTQLAIGMGFEVFLNAIVEDKKMNYRVVTKLVGMTVKVVDVGVKSSRQRNYTYISKSVRTDSRYREITMASREELVRTLIREQVPLAVMQAALYTVVTGFKAENF